MRGSSGAAVAGLVGAAVYCVIVAVRRARRRKASSGVAESTIRRMTRLAIEHGAVNLSQGFPNEAPPREMALFGAGALLCGESEATASAAAERLGGWLEEAEEEAESGSSSSGLDSLNQYSFPYGAPCLREAISRYYARRGLEYSAETEVTVCMGATEGFAACLRALAAPGEAVVFFEPFHELYPSQVAVFYLRPRAVTLVDTGDAWTFDPKALDRALRGARLFLFNSPHNPTGKVFDEAELRLIAALCRKHGVTPVTDDIYEHVLFGSRDHSPLARLERAECVVVNSVSKTCKATGWRIGWVLADPEKTRRIRAVHDQLVASCPTPLQFAVARYLPNANFASVRQDYVPKRDALLAALADAGFRLGPTPQGAYYLFADYSSVPRLARLSPVDAAVYMTATVKVACVPGDNFYLSHDSKHRFGSKYLRFAFVRSLPVIAQAAHNLRAHFRRDS